MKRFLRTHAGLIQGVLSGFDRLRFRGTLRWLAYTQGMKTFLDMTGVLLKDFKAYVQQVTDQVRASTERFARDAGRPLIHLQSPSISKEQRAREIARQDGIQKGLICVFSAVESCFSFEVRRDRDKRRLELRGRPGKCLHYYFYLQHPLFGFMHLRLQTWFPLTIHVTINGRDWLAHQLDTAGIAYQRRDNCFLQVDDLERAQKLCDRQLHTRWKGVFRDLVRQLHPAYADVFRGSPIKYYWSVDQSEWATDVMFRSPHDLAQLYPSLLRHAACDFSSAELMRFLGRKIPRHGGVHGHFQGEAISDVARRTDRLRIKHRIDRNWIKMYDKQDSLLRIETTINHVQNMKVFRRAEGQSDGPKTWLPLRKGIADFRRRAQISQAANGRYLDALAEVHAAQSLGELTDAICRPTEWNGKRVRALRPWSPEDAHLLAAISRAEFTVNGFRNRDLRPLLFLTAGDVSPEEAHRQSARITRQLRMLRAHGLITKVQQAHRYQLTVRGRKTVAALQAARGANAEQLAKLAA